jgi:hypothetical protein
MKLFAIAAIVLGAGAALVFFLLWAANGLPHQDPTPEMLKSQDLLGKIYTAGMLLSLLVASLGCAALRVVRRRLQRSSS